MPESIARDSSESSINSVKNKVETEPAKGLDQVQVQKFKTKWEQI